MTDALVVGEALIDIVTPLEGEITEHVGGSPANVAIGLARLGHETRLATWIADDDRGRRIWDLLDSEHVVIHDGSLDAARTPTANAILDAEGKATYDFDLEWRVPGTLVPVPGAHVHFGSFSATLEPGGSQVRQFGAASREYGTVSYDPNARPALMGMPSDARPKMEEGVAAADVVKASDEDIQWFYGLDDPADVIPRWTEMGVSLVIVTRGPAGVIAATKDEFRHFPAKKVNVVDSVGAGDSFMSGLLSGLLDDGFLGGPDARERLQAATLDELTPAIQRALDCADITVSRKGANPPRRNEL